MRTERYIVVNEYGEYLTPRRSTGKVYELRAGWSKNFDDVRIFNTKGAAVNSARQSMMDRKYGVVVKKNVFDYTVKKVEVIALPH